MGHALAGDLLFTKSFLIFHWTYQLLEFCVLLGSAVLYNKNRENTIHDFMNFIIFLVVFFLILHLDGGYCWIPHLELHKIKLAIYMQALLTLSCTLPSAFSSLSLSQAPMTNP